jgi:hypothetical protein
MGRRATTDHPVQGRSSLMKALSALLTHSHIEHKIREGDRSIVHLVIDAPDGRRFTFGVNLATANPNIRRRDFIKHALKTSGLRNDIRVYLEVTNYYFRAHMQTLAKRLVRVIREVINRWCGFFGAYHLVAVRLPARGGSWERMTNLFEEPLREPFEPLPT